MSIQTTKEVWFQCDLCGRRTKGYGNAPVPPKGIVTLTYERSVAQDENETIKKHLCRACAELVRREADRQLKMR